LVHSEAVTGRGGSLLLYTWKNYFSELLNVHGVSDVRQIEIQTGELLVPDPSPFGVEFAIEKFKSIDRYVVIKF
jgi:hypothetical protein